MANITLLDGNRHRTLRVRTGYRLRSHDGLGLIPILPAELDAAHKEFPLFACKQTDTGRFFFCALLAATATGNAFLDPRGEWLSRYVPLLARRGPFLMHDDGNGLKLCIDLDDPRVGGDGERLYDDAGQPTPHARHMATLMHTIHEGQQQTAALVDALTSQQLLEPIAIDHPGEMLRGLYAINPDRLKALDATVLSNLNRAGHLQAAYFLASSLGNLRPLLTSAAGPGSASASSTQTASATATTSTSRTAASA
ncbi:SapC family protein [Permianibacter sp. IMCC34836]|uniref:SapC family protein n=1 Tax=Permianibacter fluminis TaxID=2738515 RepID=UPI001554D2E9|nr:SapC family protein [Permianibacter fluminis]NQD36431.1 SapC family protein [Permianibacter fluminis]